jgi:anti-anti-sigma factor
MSLLSLQSYQEPNAVRLLLSGELDLSSALVFDEEMRKLEAETPPDHAIVLDLSGLKFLDSTGLRLILSAHLRQRKVGRRLRIVLGGEAVRRIFHLTGVFQRLDIVDEPLTTA